MLEFLEYLKTIGPFAVPLCIGMAFVIKYLVGDNKSLRQELRESQGREREALKQRGDDQVEAAKAMGASSQVVSEALLQHDTAIGKALEALEA